MEIKAGLSKSLSKKVTTPGTLSNTLRLSYLQNKVFSRQAKIECRLLLLKKHSIVLVKR